MDFHDHAVLTPFPVAPGRAGDGPAPAVLVLPGGGYWVLADHEGEPVARWLNSVGFAAFVLHYPVGDGNFHPLPLDSARGAVRHLREHADDHGIDAARLAVLGFSAGGHLAAQLSAGAEAAPEERPDGAVLVYAATCWGTLREGDGGDGGSDGGGYDSLLGPAPTRAQRASVSMDLAATAAAPPTLAVHTADDEMVPVEHSLRYAAALARLGVSVQLNVLPHGPHGFGLGEDDPAVHHWTAVAADWLRYWAAR